MCGEGDYSHLDGFIKRLASTFPDKLDDTRLSETIAKDIPGLQAKELALDWHEHLRQRVAERLGR